MKNGVLYPSTGEMQNASHLLSAVLKPDSKHRNKPSAKALYRKFSEEVESFAGTSCIISSENFYFAKPKALAKLLSDKFDVKIICYIRRQDEVLVSSFIQELRDDTLSQEERDDIDLYLSQPVRLRLLDYKSMLDKWADVFGEENILVRVYEKGQLKGDLFGDLLDAIGLSLTDEYLIPQQRINSTPSSDVLELIKMINGYPAPLLVRKQIKSRLVEVSESIGYSKKFDATGIFSPEQKNSVLKYFDKSNIETARKYLKREDGRLFYQDIEVEDVKKVEESEDHGQFDLARLIKIWVGMAVHQQQQFNKLEMQMNMLKKDASPKK
jgi:hypothetical protein